MFPRRESSHIHRKFWILEIESFRLHPARLRREDSHGPALADGGRGSQPDFPGFSGFDYVLNPGFSSNRGYTRCRHGQTGQMILERPAATVKDDRKAEEHYDGNWTRRRVSRRWKTPFFESTARQGELTEWLRRSEAKPPPRQRSNASPPFWKRSAEGTLAGLIDAPASLPLLHPGRCAAPDDGGGLFLGRQ